MKCTVCGSSIALFSRTMDGREVAWCGAHAPEDMVKALEDMVRRDSGQETLDRIKRDAHEEVERILASKNPGDPADPAAYTIVHPDGRPSERSFYVRQERKEPQE